MFKNQKGITLIALVITIIVLLILAGITIALITSNDSAPNKAAEAKIQQDVGAAKDAVTLNATSLVTEYYERKYVDSSINSTNYPTAGVYVKNPPTGTGASEFSLTDNIDTNKVTPAHTANTDTITLTSVEKNAESKSYVVTGTINSDGTINWFNADGTLNAAWN